MDISSPLPLVRLSRQQQSVRGDANMASRAEWMLTAFALTVIVSMPFIVGDQAEGRESLNPLLTLNNVSDAGDRNKQMILLGLYVACATALVMKERARAWLFIGGPIGLLLLWTFGSTIWSLSPDVTIRRSIAVSGGIIVGLYIGLRFETRRLLTLFCIVGVVVLTFSLFLMVAFPLHGLDFEGRLRGVSSDKNHLASFAALVLLSASATLGMGATSRHEKMLCGAAGVLATVCMVLAHSTSVVPVLALALMSVGMGYAMLHASPKLLALMPLVAGLALLLFATAAANSGAIAELLGKDADISGRTLVWAFSYKLIQLRPFAGYGIGSVWNGIDSPGAVFWAISHLGVPHAHNGYIQLALDLGMVGVALFAAACVMLVLKALWLTVYMRHPDAPWSFGFLALYLVANYSEAWLWVGNELVLTMLIALIVRTNANYWKYSHARGTCPPIPGGV